MSDKAAAPAADEQMWLAMQKEDVKRGTPREITILGKTYTLYPISNKIDAKIAALAFDALFYEREAKKDNISRRKAKRLNTKIRQIPAKIAAYYKLGRWAHRIPLAHAIYWRKLWRRSEEVSATINSQGATGTDKDFFLANSEVIKYLLALSMRGVGESVKQMLERKESAESMLDEDASPKKEEDSKSAAHSPRARKPKR